MQKSEVSANRSAERVDHPKPIVKSAQQLTTERQEAQLDADVESVQKMYEQESEKEDSLV